MSAQMPGESWGDWQVRELKAEIRQKESELRAADDKCLEYYKLVTELRNVIGKDRDYITKLENYRGGFWLVAILAAILFIRSIIY